MEIYQRIDGDYANIGLAIDEKYGTNIMGEPRKLSNPISSADDGNRSNDYGDYEYLGNGIFIYRWNRLEQGHSVFCYNGFEVTIDLEPIYRVRTTPYYNCSAGDFKYRISDYKYAYFVDWCVDQKESSSNSHPHNILATDGYSKYNWEYNVKLGPTPTYRKIKQVELGTETNWNKDYKHHYIGTSWSLSINQTYAEYYARDVYWWEEDLSDDINKLLTLSSKHHGQYVGKLTDDAKANSDYSDLLLRLINHFSKKNYNPYCKEWVIKLLDDGKNIDHNLYACKIICDNNTRGLVIEIPLNRKGPVGKLFLPFIKPDSENRYTPTPYRCDFHNFLWYHIPWEKDNSIRYLMMTDTEICELNGNKVKAFIATRRGHTKDDMPYLSDEDVEKMVSFWGYGHHYRLNPTNLFENGITIKVPSLIEFDKTEENLFNLINKQTGVLFPIDNNQIDWQMKTGLIEAKIVLNGKRSEVFFSPEPILVTLVEGPLNLLTMFDNKSSTELETLWSMDMMEDKLCRDSVDLFLYSYLIDVTKTSIDKDLTTNFPMLKSFKADENTKDLPTVQVSYLTEIFKRYISYAHFVNVEPELVDRKKVIINLKDCQILYNGENSIDAADKYFSPGRLKNILVIKPNHPYYAHPYRRWLTISYED